MISLAFLVAALLAPAPDPILLDSIASREARVATLHESCAFTTTRRTETLDAKGKVTSWSETEERHGHRDGAMSREVIRHTVDGKDRTEAMRRESAPEELEVVEPFSTASKGDYRFESLGADPETGWTRVGFEPKRKGLKNGARGTAAVESSTGAIRRMDYEPEQLGTFVQKMKVSMEYDLPSPEGPTL